MLKERLSLTKKQMINFLFTAGGVGLVIANHAGIAGATGAAKLKSVVPLQWELLPQSKLPMEQPSKVHRRCLSLSPIF